MGKTAIEQILNGVAGETVTVKPTYVVVNDGEGHKAVDLVERGIVNRDSIITAPKNKYWKFQLPSSDMFAAALFHQGLSCQKSYPHSLDARGPRSKIVDI